MIPYTSSSNHEELDDESAKFIQESLDSWKEKMLDTLQEEVEKIKADKLEELEEANAQYREELKEEYSEKLIAAVADLKESIRAEVVAETLKNNPELNILEQIKGLVAPLLNEDFRDNAYSDTIAQLSEENEELRRNQEITEGAQVLAELLAPYAEKTQNFVLSLIHEGSPEEVTEQFYTIMESLQGIFGEAGEEDDGAAEEENNDDEGKSKKSKKSEEDDDDDDGEDDGEDDDDDDDGIEESYLNEGFDGDDDFDNDRPAKGSLKDIISKYAQK
jgi:hypothetical protein